MGCARRGRVGVVALAVAAMLAPLPAAAQRSAENVVAAAQDAFGTVVGGEKIGIYNDQDVRGFSPVKAGNLRMEGVYFDQAALTNSRFRAGSSIRVGAAALDYAFPAPTGIVDYRLRPSGETRVVSVEASHLFPYGGYSLNFDAQLPIVANRLSVAVGAASDLQGGSDGSTVRYRTVGLVPRIRFSDGEITPVFGFYATRQASTRPVIAAPGAFVPDFPARRRYLGQSWSDNNNDNLTLGVITRTRLADRWSVRGGIFESAVLRRRNYSELITVATPDGAGRHRIVADPRQKTNSLSGEAQLVWNQDDGRLHHRMLFMVRGRDRLNETGGSDVVDLGPVVRGARDPEPRPDFRFGPVDEGRVRQLAGGISYAGRLDRIGEVNIGLQKTAYRASFRRLDQANVSSVAPWLYNAAVVLHPRRSLTLYATYVRGLEDSGVAPENAANRNEQLPASLTTQIDGGVRLGQGATRLVVSAFSIKKPYFSFDAANRFTGVGTVRHQGVEASYSGMVGRRLHLLAGAVLMHPVVSGPARSLGRSGERPAGTTPLLVRLDADYHAPIEGLSFTAALVHTGRRTASSRTYAELDGAQLETPAYTTIDLGVRYRFKLHETPMSLRLLATNVFDVESWKILAPNTYQENDTRRLLISLIGDF